MFPQIEMIERVRHICQADERLVAAMMYGSFAKGEGDEYSDIEFVLFFSDESLASINQQEWVAQIAPLRLYFDDDVGHHTAIFSNFVRGEFHFEPASRIPIVSTWRGNAWFPSTEATILVDRTGEIGRYIQPLISPPPERDTPAMVQSLIEHFINWVLFGTNVLARGEYARALTLLSITHTYLLKMARLVEGATLHWPTPSQRLEQDLSAGFYERYRACTASLDRKALEVAYRETWTWGRELMELLARRHNLALPTALIDQLAERIMTET